MDTFGMGVDRHGAAGRMQNPKFFVGDPDFVGIGPSFASPEVKTAPGHSAVDEVSGAAGPMHLPMVHEDIDLERAGDGRDAGADAPAPGQVAGRAVRSLFGLASSFDGR